MSEIDENSTKKLNVSRWSNQRVFVFLLLSERFIRSL
jgi:hypothetical protein